MVESILKKRGNVIIPSDTVEVKIFQNKTNKQFNLPVLKKNTSPQIIQDILSNKNVIGLKFKITDVILRDNIEKDAIFKNNIKGGKV